MNNFHDLHCSAGQDHLSGVWGEEVPSQSIGYAREVAIQRIYKDDTSVVIWAKKRDIFKLQTCYL